MEETKGELCRQLDTVDTSLGFLLLVITSVLLSFFAVTIQRRQLCLTILGDREGEEALGEVYPIRRLASALIVGSLGYFLCLAWRAAGENCQGADCVSRRSARTNLWASVLVLSAAILRFNDLNFVHRCSQGEASASETV